MLNLDEEESDLNGQTLLKEKETAEPVPIWLIVFSLFCLYRGAVYFDTHAAWFSPQVYAPFRSVSEVQAYQPKSDRTNLERGKQVYESLCGLCHGSDGLGKTGQAPPLAGSEWVQAEPSGRLILIPLYGVSGPIEVRGALMNFSAGGMGPMGATLPVEDLSAVLTYVRQAWGNHSSAVTVEQIEVMKSAIGNRSRPFTAAELLEKIEVR
jgi:mono/diheme cytochrome c family protein